MADVRPTQCPNCGEPAIFDARTSVIICEKEDAEFKVTKQGGAKVKKTGVLDDHEKRLAALEQKKPTDINSGFAPEPDPDEIHPSNGDDETDEEIFPE